MATLITWDSATAFLADHGIETEKISEILQGFDFGRPIYLHDFWPDDELYQLVRHSSAMERSVRAGNWFGLAGITASGVAINDGLSGRHLVRYKVVSHFRALEGTAARFKVDLGKAIGGKGGSTQIFVPRRLIGHLCSVGPA
jgi:hypothetical protein